MIMYTEKQLNESYANFLQSLKRLPPMLGIRLIPSLEEYRTEIFEPGWEQIMEDDFWSDDDNTY